MDYPPALRVGGDASPTSHPVAHSALHPTHMAKVVRSATRAYLLLTYLLIYYRVNLLQT